MDQKNSGSPLSVDVLEIHADMLLSANSHLDAVMY
jgi:hypothetical protein